MNPFAKPGAQPAESGMMQLLRRMGIDPQLLMEQVINQAQPAIDRVLTELQAAEARQMQRFDYLGQRFDKIETTLHKLDPDYIPEGFSEGLMEIDFSQVIEPMIANPDTPDGGAVDMQALDQERIPGGATEIFEGDPEGEAAHHAQFDGEAGADTAAAKKPVAARHAPRRK